MLIAKVVGEVVASHKVPALQGHKLLLIQPTDPRGQPKGGHLVATDGVGAGVGEIVLVCQGSSARMTAVSENRPVDAVIMGIIDQISDGGTLTYRKDS
jgi:microcompartment protein CcmK/EutM